MIALPRTLTTQVFVRMRTAMRSRTLRIISVFAGGNLLATVLTVFGSIIQARFVGPEEMGIFRTFSLVVGYLSFLHLGTIDGLQRQLPYLIGSGNRSRAERAASASLAWTLLASTVCAAAFLGLALWEALHCRWMGCCGWLAHAPVVLLSLYGMGLGTTYRTSGDFARLSVTNVGQATLGVLLLPVLPWLSYYGVCLRTSLVAAFHVVLLQRFRPLRMRLRLRFRDLWSVLKIGLPLSLVGYVATSFWLSVEGSIVLRYFGTEALGLFSVVVMFRFTTCQLVQNVNQFYMPKIAEQFGRSGRTADCLRLATKPMLLAGLATLPMIALGWLLVSPAVSLAIPKYVAAIPAMQWSLPMMLVLVFNLPLYVLNASGRCLEYGLSVAAGLLCFCVAAAVAARGGGLVGIVLASTFGHVVQTVAAYALIHIRTRSEERNTPEPVPG